MKRFNAVFHLLNIFLASTLIGCGYAFQGSGTVLPPDVKKVYIPFVENQSTEAGLSTLLTEALRDRFERYGVLTVVEENSEADAVLKAKILKVKRATASVTSNTDRALQQDVSLTVAAELKRNTGLLLWRNPSLLVTSSYGAASSAVVTSSSEFAGGTLGASDLSALESTGTREVTRGQEQETFNKLAEEVARVIYDDAVAPDF